MSGEPEETVVFNYLVEEFVHDTSSSDKQEDSFDENQNSKSNKQGAKRKRSTDRAEHRVLRKRESPATPARKPNQSCGAEGTVARKGRKTQTGSPKPIKVNYTAVKENEGTLKLKNLEKLSVSNGPDVCSENITIKIENFEDESTVNNKSTSLCAGNTDTSLIGGDNVEVKLETDHHQDDSGFKSDSKSTNGSPNEKKSENGINKLNLLEPNLQNTQYEVVDLEPKCKITQNVFKCTKCLYVGNSKANLERHSLIHMDPSEILWFKCSDCEYKSKYESQLKSHMIVHKKPDEIQYFQCPLCDLKCTRKHNLNNHIRTIHTDRVNNLKCAECSYTTFSKDRMVAHVKMHSTEVFTCNLCKFVTKSKDYLNSHFKQKHTDVVKPFPCDTCSYKGKTKRELLRHYNRMHNKEQLKSFQCNHCSFSSIYKKNLEFHLLHMHQKSEGFQKFICGHCYKDFAYKNGLKTHIIRMHLKLTEEDWHKCQECKYKCKDVNTLKRHIKRNHGAPRLHCNECNFTTNRQKSLTAHLKTHEVLDNGRILKCPECPYRIIQTASFFYHIKAVHGKPISSKDVHKFYLNAE